MEGICVVGGIKSEPSILEYVRSSVEITFSDIDSGEDEPKKVNRNQLTSVLEHHTISVKEEVDKDKETEDVFRYMGYDPGESNEGVEQYVFNFTKNEDLFVYTKEDKEFQVSDQFKGASSPTTGVSRCVSNKYNNVESNTNDNDCPLESYSSEGSDTEENVKFSKGSRLKSQQSSENVKKNKSKMTNGTSDEISDDSAVKPKTTKHEYVYLPQSKIDLSMAIFSENFFSGEYQKMDTDYHCMHCGSQEYTLKKIKGHIIENHRETKLKQCPHCDVKTKVLKHHLKSHRGNCTRLSSGEYREKHGLYHCLHCAYKDTLEKIKAHISTIHRKTEVKQCILCNTRTKTLTYHLKTIHNCTPNQAPLLLAEYAEINKNLELKKKSNDEDSAATTGVQVNDNQPVIFMTKKPRHKIDLNSALYSEEFSCLEYKKREYDYRCQHCGHREKVLEKIKAHVIENHRKTDLKQCPFCDVQTKVLKYHLRIHDAPSEYQCRECNYKAANTIKLNRHIRERHKEHPMVKCNVCHKIFSTKARLLQHIRRCHRDTEKVFACKFCSYTSNIKGSVTAHMERHLNEDELKTVFKCDKCNFQTKYRKLFTSHKSTRHKMFVCDQCGTKVSSKPSLKLHMLLHKNKLEDEDLPIRCDKCNYKTSRHYNLAVHKLKHKKPEEKEYFYCYHCNFKANRKDNLKTHIFKHFQKEEVVFYCFICDFTTKKKSKLIRHIDDHSTTN